MPKPTLEYHARFYTNDVVKDIAARLEPVLPRVSLKERYRLAEGIIAEIVDLGNMAAYQGLVDYGLKLIAKKS